MNDLVAEQVRRLAPWYHTFDLPGGITTEGYFDLRGVPRKLPLPESLEGKRVLDAAACEGFWSFELAHRGAAEVISADLPDTAEQDWQGVVAPDARRVGTGLANEHFNFVRHALGVDRITRVDVNLYDLAAAGIGLVDYVFIGNVLIHLADPARALRAIRGVLRPGGEILSLEPVSLPLSLLAPRRPMGRLWDRDDQPRWWTPNMAAHRRLLHAAGFEVTGQGGPLLQPLGTVLPRWPRNRPRAPSEIVFWLAVRRFGQPSSWARGRPRPGPDTV